MSTLTLVAYHNDQQIKSEILAQLARHRAADDLVQGHCELPSPEGEGLTDPEIVTESTFAKIGKLEQFMQTSPGDQD